MSCEFYLPVRIIAGRDGVLQQAALFAETGKHAFIVTGNHSARENGALADVLQVLKANGQAYTLFDRVMSNPTVACVYEGAKEARECGADFVIAIGGGSPMDAAKSIAWLACQDIPQAEIFTTVPEGTILPFLCIPTTAGTGSEVTQYSVLLNDAQKSKSSVASPFLFAKAALLDGKYMRTLPQKSTVHTGLDALSHLVESILSKRATEISKAIAFRGLASFAPYLKRLNSTELTLKDRDILLEASCLGGAAIAQTSTTAVHLMGYPLTYFHQIDHGRANGLLLGAYLTLAEEKAPQAVRDVLDVLGFSAVSKLAEVIAGLLGEKDSISAAEAKEFAAASIKAPKCQSGIISLTEAEIEAIYRASLNIQ